MKDHDKNQAPPLFVSGNKNILLNLEKSVGSWFLAQVINCTALQKNARLTEWVRLRFFQSTVKPITCTINTRPTDLSRLKPGKLNRVAKIMGLATHTLLLSLASQGMVHAKGEITVINTELVPGTPTSYTAKNRYGRTKTYLWGQGNNFKITGFEYSDTTFNYENVADYVAIRRVDNAQRSGSDGCGLFAQKIGNSYESHEADYPYAYTYDAFGNQSTTNTCDMAAIMGGRTINVGALDVFANTGPSSQSGSFNNIERVDFIFSAGIQSPKNTDDLSQAGHVATEKSGNNPFKIAAILSLDASGDPASYGSAISICPAVRYRARIANCDVAGKFVNYGISTNYTKFNFLSNSKNGSVGGAGWIGQSVEPLGMAFISLEDLGVPANTTYYGFSYFGHDVNSSANLVDYHNFPQDTWIGGLLSPGQADMYGGVAGYFVDECLAFSGDVSEVSPALTTQIRSGDFIYIPSTTLTPSEGHLSAYAIQADGSIATTATWDATSLMNQGVRETHLYTTDSSDEIILFTATADAAFNSVIPSADQIRNYTIEPSFDSNAYLAGRESGSFLGTISRGNDTALVNKEIDGKLYLSDSDYQNFQKNTISSRADRILVNSDDGFLYAFDTSGALAWGWMPKSLLAELKDYNNFHLNSFMKGDIDVIDAKHSGSFSTYVVGGYKEGRGHYSLKLDADGNLDSSNSFIWDEDNSSAYSQSPNNGDMEFFDDSTGKTYGVYVLTTTANTSTVMIRNIADASDSRTVQLNYKVTSSPYVMPTFAKSSAPASKVLYLGDSIGNIHAAPLLETFGSDLVVDSSVDLATELNDATNIVGTLGSSEPILFMGASTSTANSKYYLRAQSKNRITILEYAGSSTTPHPWKKKWTSYKTGAGTWAANGSTYTADASGAPTDPDGDGFATHVSTGIQGLPVNSAITGAATIVSGAVVLPVSVGSGTVGDCNPPLAYYYLYNLTDGTFPSDKFFNLDGTAIDEDLIIGYGEPTKLMLSDLPNDKLLGTGNSDQDDPKSTRSFYIYDKFSTGLRGWQEIEN